MFICLDCMELFEEPKRWQETHGLEYGPYEEWPGCPKCGGAYAEAFKCDCCDNWIDGTYVKTDDDRRYCFNCYRVTDVGDEY